MINETTQTESVQMQAINRQVLDIADGAIQALEDAVIECQANGGGIVALVGAAGSGKSVRGKEFALKHRDAVYLDGLSQGSNRRSAPDLAGIPVIDEAWQFEGIAQSIKSHVTQRSGTVIAIGCSDLEVREICGEYLRAVVELSDWPLKGFSNGKSGVTNVQHAIEIKQQVIQMQKISGIIRFRGPNGESWTGYGRAPKWLVALESNGFSRELYRIDSAPLSRSKKTS